VYSESFEQQNDILRKITCLWQERALMERANLRPGNLSRALAPRLGCNHFLLQPRAKRWFTLARQSDVQLRQRKSEIRELHLMKVNDVNDATPQIDAPPAPTTQVKDWLAIADVLATRFAKQVSRPELADQLARILAEQGGQGLLAETIAAALMKDITYIEFSDLAAFQRKFPVLVLSNSNTPFIITAKAANKSYAVTGADETNQMIDVIATADDVQHKWSKGIIFDDRLPLDVWQQDFENTGASNWFWGSLKPLLKSMKYLLWAALFGNILSIAVSLFAMQVWDRVIPAQSANSLVVLAIGVILAAIFELVLRLQRAALIDQVGKGVDHHISASVFRHMMQLKADARPTSLGSLASQIREINQIREAISSSMLSAAIDIPFVFVYLVVIFLIGGVLVYPLLAVIPVVVVMGLIAQVPLSKLAKQGLEEASLRNGLIVEAVLKADEVKLQEAEDTLQLRWNNTVEKGQDVSIQQRFWRNLLINGTQTLQQFGYIGVVVLGAVMVMDGTATMGQVIGCSILANRAIAPLTQVSTVLAALQGSILAKHSIDEMMSRPADSPNPQHLRRELKTPEISVNSLKYHYPGTEKISLDISDLKISYGERIGVVGRIGSGKSTLLRVLSGLAEPRAGTIMLDNTEINAIHPADVRRTIAYQSQGSALFRGTIRDNLAIARPSANDAQMVEACAVSGVLDLIKTNARGLDLQINEAGQGLSGGQKQSLLLARAILRNPKILLLDEPTASMDDQTEAKFATDLNTWAGERSIVIATHRMRPLAICNRLLVIDNGRIVMDGPKEEIIAKLARRSGA
jgi:ATP-binding cassette, subfamily C, bacterial LapB